MGWGPSHLGRPCCRLGPLPQGSDPLPAAPLAPCRECSVNLWAAWDSRGDSGLGMVGRSPLKAEVSGTRKSGLVPTIQNIGGKASGSSGGIRNPSGRKSLWIWDFFLSFWATVGAGRGNWSRSCWETFAIVDTFTCWKQGLDRVSASRVWAKRRSYGEFAGKERQALPRIWVGNSLGSEDRRGGNTTVWGTDWLTGQVRKDQKLLFYQSKSGGC